MASRVGFWYPLGPWIPQSKEEVIADGCLRSSDALMLLLPAVGSLGTNSRRWLRQQLNGRLETSSCFSLWLLRVVCLGIWLGTRTQLMDALSSCDKKGFACYSVPCILWLFLCPCYKKGGGGKGGGIASYNSWLIGYQPPARPVLCISGAAMFLFKQPHFPFH